MQNIVDIKHHIKSIKDISQITKAMEMISISKMRKANENYINNFNYYSNVRKTMKDILNHKGDIEHPYIKHREKERTAFVVISSDTGMAGDYNNRVLNYAYKKITECKDDTYVFTIGHMAESFFLRKGIATEEYFVNYIQNPSISNARFISAYLVNLYDENKIDEINIIYTNQNENRIIQANSLRLLPILKEDFDDVNVDMEYNAVLDFEPSAEEVFNILAPQYILGVTYSCMIQSIKCEHMERMEAMRSATNNAKDMLDDLEISYHRARQEQITTQLIEISSGHFTN